MQDRTIFFFSFLNQCWSLLFHFISCLSFGDMHFQDTWEEVDPDELSYEVSCPVDCTALLFSLSTLTKDFIFQELLALGEVVGTENRGLSTDSIASLPSVLYKAGSSQTGSNDS